MFCVSMHFLQTLRQINKIHNNKKSLCKAMTLNSTHVIFGKSVASPLATSKVTNPKLS